MRLFTETEVLIFPRMFMNTFIIAVFTCVISVSFVLLVSFCLSRLRFPFRRIYINTALVLGMFPGIMAVVAIYFILKALRLTGGSTTNIALIIVYSAGAGMTFYMMKGYMDTIPASLDEAAYLDGCSKWQVFYLIILPIVKPMIVYQAITGFLIPWLDFVLARAIARTRIYSGLVCPVCGWRRLRVDPHCDLVHSHAAVLPGVHGRLREGLI